MRKVFVIIVTYKGHQWYERCFTSLRGSEYPVETIVIDNASNDGTVEYIRNQFPEILLIESKENLGFGRANNIGMRYALDRGCDYVFLLNQDAWIESNTISELVRIHCLYPEYNILSPIHLNADKKHIETGMFSYMINEKITDVSLVQDLYFGRLHEIYESKYINAAGWLIPINTIEIIGGFCPLIYHYGEDDDYLNRLHYHNMKLGICPNVRIVHDAIIKSSHSKLLNKKAHLLDVDELIDINNSDSIHRQIFLFFKRGLKYGLRMDYMLAKENIQKLLYIIKNYNNIKKCMQMHKIKQSCWL